MAASSAFDTIVIPKSTEWEILSEDAASNAMGWRQPQYDVRLRGTLVDDDLEDRLDADGFPEWGKMLLPVVDAAEDYMRFVDIRNPLYTNPPAKDGSNMTLIGGPDASRTFQLYKRLLTGLYRETLIDVNGYQPVPQGGANFLMDDSKLVDLIESARALFHGCTTMEDQRLDAPHFAQSSIRPGFEWVEAWQESMAEGAAAVQAVYWWAEEYGYDPMDHVDSAWESIPHISRLLMILIWRDDRFEDRLLDEHVEDILMDKRLWYIDHRHIPQIDVDGGIDLVQRLDEQVKPNLSDYQLDIRQSFDYRQLRYWGLGRHWKKLYVVFDTTANPGQSQYIRAFNSFVQNHSTFAYNLFGVHPIEKNTIPAGDTCTICVGEFESQELVMELNCGHKFHPSCIFGHWDSDTIFNNPCANCRQSQGRLRDKLDFHAEKDDVDFGTEAGRQQLDEYQYDPLIARNRQNQVPMNQWGTVLVERCWRVVQQRFRAHERQQKMSQPGATWGVLE